MNGSTLMYCCSGGIPFVIGMRVLMRSLWNLSS